MGSHRRAQAEKRQQKLALHGVTGEAQKVTPLKAATYQTDYWARAFHQTELGILEAHRALAGQLTDAQVRSALIELARSLKGGMPPLREESAAAAPIDPGHPTPLVIDSIRRRWKVLFEIWHPVSPDDLVGILRTLLSSIDVRKSSASPDTGYLAFLDRFLPK